MWYLVPNEWYNEGFLKQKGYRNIEMVRRRREGKTSRGLLTQHLNSGKNTERKGEQQVKEQLSCQLDHVGFQSNVTDLYLPVFGNWYSTLKCLLKHLSGALLQVCTPSLITNQNKTLNLKQITLNTQGISESDVSLGFRLFHLFMHSGK